MFVYAPEWRQILKNLREKKVVGYCLRLWKAYGLARRTQKFWLIDGETNLYKFNI